MSLARAKRLPTARDWRRRQGSESGEGAQDEEETPDKPREDTGERRKRKEWRRFLWQIFDQFKDDLVVVVAATVWGIIQLSATTVQSGTNGLRFTFGRVSKVLEPGFHPLIPFVQRVKKLPTRSRTLDLPSQRVVNREGLVYNADANLVYRVIDIRKALIEIDVLERGMLQMLTLGVQEVLRRTDRISIRNTEALNLALTRTLERRLEPWGVSVERAGFPSIAPGPRTLRITQLEENTLERLGAYRGMLERGISSGRALGLVGTRQIHRTRVRELRGVEDHRRRVRRLRKKLKTKGWTAVEIKQAELSLLSRLTSRGRVRVG